MEDNEIFSKLCHYDKRNPDNYLYIVPDSLMEKYSAPIPNCQCDNCFYGRTKLAEYIIKLEEELEAWRMSA